MKVNFELQRQKKLYSVAQDDVWFISIKKSQNKVWVSQGRHPSPSQLVEITYPQNLYSQQKIFLVLART